MFGYSTKAYVQKHLQMFNDEIISRQLPIEKTRKATMCKISGSEPYQIEIQV